MQYQWALGILWSDKEEKRFFNEESWAREKPTKLGNFAIVASSPAKWEEPKTYKLEHGIKMSNGKLQNDKKVASGNNNYFPGKKYGVRRYASKWDSGSGIGGFWRQCIRWTQKGDVMMLLIISSRKSAYFFMAGWKTCQQSKWGFKPKNKIWQLNARV